MRNPWEFGLAIESTPSNKKGSDAFAIALEWLREKKSPLTTVFEKIPPDKRKDLEGILDFHGLEMTSFRALGPKEAEEAGELLEKWQVGDPKNKKEIEGALVAILDN